MALDPGQRLLDAADDAVTKLLAAWTAMVAPDEVKVLYAEDIPLTPDDAEVIEGRKVYVLPAGYDAADQYVRTEVLTRYTLGVLVVERFADAGAPPPSWVRERVAFVGRTVFATLRNPGLVLASTMRPDFESGEPAGAADEVYDLAILTRHKAFWSALTFRYVEISDY